MPLRRLAWVADSVERLETVNSNVVELPGGAAFGTSYQQFVQDADDHFVDANLEDNMCALANSFPGVAKLLETPTNAAAFR